MERPPRSTVSFRKLVGSTLPYTSCRTLKTFEKNNKPREHMDLSFSHSPVFVCTFNLCKFYFMNPTICTLCSLFPHEEGEDNKK